MGGPTASYSRGLITFFLGQADMDRQRPFSRAYRSFYPTRDDGGIVVHLGSGAVAAAGDSVEAKDSAELGGEGGGGGDPGGVSDEGRRGAEELFEGSCSVCKKYFYV